MVMKPAFAHLAGMGLPSAAPLCGCCVLLQVRTTNQTPSMLTSEGE